jgi:hypothetical protein
LRLNDLIPKNLKLVSASALFLAGLAMVMLSIAPAGQGTALADPPGNDGVCEHARSEKDCRDDPQPDHGKDCESHAANFDGNEDHCKKDDHRDHKTKTPTATATFTATATNTATATSTPEDPTATPTEEPTETPTPTEEPTETPTPTETAATGAVVQPTATPILVIELAETAVAEEEAVLAAEETVEAVAVLPASGSGGSGSSGTGLQLGLGIAAMVLGSLLGYFGLKLDARKETS